MGKGEIARYKQFFLFPQCFQKPCFPELSKGVIVWEWVNQSLFQQQGNSQVIHKIKRMAHFNKDNKSNNELFQFN